MKSFLHNTCILNTKMVIFFIFLFVFIICNFALALDKTEKTKIVIKSEKLANPILLSSTKEIQYNSELDAYLISASSEDFNILISIKNFKAKDNKIFYCILKSKNTDDSILLSNDYNLEITKEGNNNGDTISGKIKGKFENNKSANSSNKYDKIENINIECSFEGIITKEIYTRGKNKFKIGFAIDYGIATGNNAPSSSFMSELGLGVKFGYVFYNINFLDIGIQIVPSLNIVTGYWNSSPSIDFNIPLRLVFELKIGDKIKFFLPAGHIGFEFRKMFLNNSSYYSLDNSSPPLNMVFFFEIGISFPLLPIRFGLNDTYIGFAVSIGEVGYRIILANDDYPYMNYIADEFYFTFAKLDIDFDTLF